MKCSGWDIGCSDAPTFWTAVLRKLARRGLSGVDPRIEPEEAISDPHEGRKAAATKVPGARSGADGEFLEREPERLGALQFGISQQPVHEPDAVRYGEAGAADPSPPRDQRSRAITIDVCTKPRRSKK